MAVEEAVEDEEGVEGEGDEVGAVEGRGVGAREGFGGGFGHGEEEEEEEEVLSFEVWWYREVVRRSRGCREATELERPRERMYQWL